MIAGLIENTSYNPSIDLNALYASIIFILIIGYILLRYFGYWLNPFHKHKMNQTVEEYFEHIKINHPDIWKKYNLTDKDIKELVKRMKDEDR
jgi:hypothetical protein